MLKMKRENNKVVELAKMHCENCGGNEAIYCLECREYECAEDNCAGLMIPN